MIIIFKRFALYFLNERLEKVFDTVLWDRSYIRRMYEGINLISASSFMSIFIYSFIFFTDSGLR